MELKIDQQAPDFELMDFKSKKHRLSDFKGRWVVLYFYPKDDTPGCTKEACAFRDSYKQFEEQNIQIIGVSIDGVQKHQKFIEKYSLPFMLLSDTDKTVVNLYNAWGKKKFMGREYEGTYRYSYLIDPKGLIKKKYTKVKPELHAQEVLNDIKESQ